MWHRWCSRITVERGRYAAVANVPFLLFALRRPGGTNGRTRSAVAGSEDQAWQQTPATPELSKCQRLLRGTNPALYSLTLVLIAVTSLQKYYTPHSNTATH